MNTPTNLEKLERRVVRYDAQDGITETLMGILFLCMGALMGKSPFAFGVALAVFPLMRVSTLLKKRYTWPRIGYVKLREETGGSARGVLGFFGIALFTLAAGHFIFGDITSMDQWMKWLPAAMAAASSGGLLHMAGKSRLTRHYVLAGINLGLGIACSLLPARDVYEGIRHWALGLGAVSLIMGVALFAHFIRTCPVIDMEAGDG